MQQEDVPKPPMEEQLALEQIMAARRAYQAQALKESRKVRIGPGVINVKKLTLVAILSQPLD